MVKKIFRSKKIRWKMVFPILLAKLICFLQNMMFWYRKKKDDLLKIMTPALPVKSSNFTRKAVMCRKKLNCKLRGSTLLTLWVFHFENCAYFLWLSKVFECDELYSFLDAKVASLNRRRYTSVHFILTPAVIPLIL